MDMRALGEDGKRGVSDERVEWVKVAGETGVTKAADGMVRGMRFGIREW